jgi:hypothetical protein
MDRVLVVRPDDRLATNRLGAYAEAKGLERAVEKGIDVFKPVFECRVDFILYDGLKLYRTQVKYTARSSPRQCRGVVPVRLSKWRNDGRAVIPYYTAEEIDLLLVYVRKIDKILAFGPEAFDRRQNLFIRIEPTRNNQKKGCLMAADYIW